MVAAVDVPRLLLEDDGEKVAEGRFVIDDEEVHGGRLSLRLRDSEQIPLLEQGGIEAFIQREVLPYTPDAWVDESKTQIGYEVSFTRHFYKPQRLRTLDEIAADIVATEKEAEGLLQGLVNDRGEVKDAGHGRLPGKDKGSRVVYKDRANRQPHAFFAKCQLKVQARSSGFVTSGTSLPGAVAGPIWC